MYSLSLGALGLLFVLVFSVRTGCQEVRRNAEPLDDYDHKISWETEKLVLDNFAIYLKLNPEMVGYLVYIVGERDELKNVKKRVVRARAYVVNKRNISPSRVIVVCGWKAESSGTMILAAVNTIERPSFNCDVR